MQMLIFQTGSDSSTPTPGRSLVRRSGRLTLAASVLGSARQFEDACPPSSRNGVAASSRHGGAFDVAIRFYEDGQWAAAFTTAASQADAGNAAAAKLALLMVRYGAFLYGIGFEAEPRRIARWAKSVIESTRGAQPVAGLDDATPASPPPASQRTPRSTSRRTASPNSITAIA